MRNQKTKGRGFGLSAGSDDMLFKHVVTEFLQRSGTSLPSRDVGLLFLRTGRYDDLVRWTESLLNFTEYSSASQFLLATQLAALIRKYPFTRAETPELDPDARALGKFKGAEHLCKRYNSYFRLQRNKRERYAVAKQLMRTYIKGVLGKLNILDVYDECDFGPGASVGVGGVGTNAARKLLAAKWSVTPTAVPYALGALWHNAQVRELLLNPSNAPYYCLDPDRFYSAVQSRLELVGYNKIAIVPKTASCSRTIAVEPLLNTFLQKGVDVVMRKKLLRNGIDLSDQKRNQALALCGSLGGSDPYVTIDLSSASDSISMELVRELLPFEWFDFLRVLRSPCYQLPDGSYQPYQKFVSMGNGFCFPLETLLFASVCHAASMLTTCDGTFSVYGDDIIVRQSTALLVLELLRALGFRHNPDKTFLFGPFRESCGGDYLLGVPVRPVYLHYRLNNTQALMKFHNMLRRNVFWSSFSDDLKLWSFCPKDERFFRQSQGQADTAFEVDRDIFMSSPFVKWNRHEQRWSWKEFLVQPVTDPICRRLPSPVLLWAALRGSPSSQPYTFRRKTRTLVKRT